MRQQPKLALGPTGTAALCPSTPLLLSQCVPTLPGLSRALNGSRPLRFEAGGVCVEVTCRGGEVPALAELLRLYPSSERPPRITYRFERQGGLWSVARDEAQLWQGDDPGEVLAAFELDLYRETVAVLPEDWLCFHAGAVAFAQGALLFCAASGGGKSSLCTAAVAAGGAYLSDELVPMDPQGGIHPFPRPLQWDGGRHPAFDDHALVASGRFASASYGFPDRETGTPIRSLLLLPQRVQSERQSLQAIVLPQFAEGFGQVEFKRVTKGQGVMALAAQTYWDGGQLDLIRRIAARLPDVPVVSLRFGDVHAAWQVVAEVFRLSPQGVAGLPHHA